MEKEQDGGAQGPTGGGTLTNLTNKRMPLVQTCLRR